MLYIVTLTHDPETPLKSSSFRFCNKGLNCHSVAVIRVINMSKF